MAVARDCRHCSAPDMYGFESTVLVALQSGNAFSAGRPFYRGCCSELATVPQPRIWCRPGSSARADWIRCASAVNDSCCRRPPALAEPGAGVSSVLRPGCWNLWIRPRRSDRQPPHRSRRRMQLFEGCRVEQGGRNLAEGGHVSGRPRCAMCSKSLDRPFLLHGRLSDLVNMRQAQLAVVFESPLMRFPA